MGLFAKKKKINDVELSPVLQPEDPVNYNSVVDYLVGLSRYDYDKLLKVANIYRDANKSAAKVLGVNNEPTTAIVSEKPTDEEMEDALDQALAGIATDYEETETPLDKHITLDKKSKPQPSDK